METRSLGTALWLVALFGAGLIPPILIAVGFLKSFFQIYPAPLVNAQLLDGLKYVVVGAVIQLASTIAVWLITARLVRLRGQSSSTATVLSVFVGIWLAGAGLGLTFYASVFFQHYQQ